MAYSEQGGGIPGKKGQPEPQHVIIDKIEGLPKRHLEEKPQPQHIIVDNNLDSYLAAASSAAKRSQATVIVLLIACVLSIIGCWNQQKDSWLHQRIAVVRDALDWVKFPDDTIVPSKIPLKNIWSIQRDISRPWLSFIHGLRIKKLILSRQMVTAHSLLPSGLDFKLPDKDIVLDFPQFKKKFLNGLYPKKILQVAKYLNHHQTRSRKQLEQRLENLERNYVENVLRVNVSFLGVSFDINDLALFTGLSFISLLIFLTFCLQREMGNVSAFFKEHTSWEAYQILAMSQLFTVPRRVPGKKNSWRDSLRVYTSAIVFIPVLILLVIWWNDLSSEDYGNAISEEKTNTNFIISTILLFSNVMLSGWAFSNFKKINRKWDSEFDKFTPSSHKLSNSLNNLTWDKCWSNLRKLIGVLKFGHQQ